MLKLDIEKKARQMPKRMSKERGKGLNSAGFKQFLTNGMNNQILME